MRGLELLHECFQSDAAGYGEGADGVGKPGIFGSNEIGERATGFVTLAIRLLAQKMQPVEDFASSTVRIQLQIVACRVGRKKSVDRARSQQLLRDDAIQEHIGFCENLPRLLALALVVKNSRVNAL